MAELSDVELWRRVVGHFGLRRTMALVAWATWWEISGHHRKIRAAIVSGETAGLFSKSTAYRALEDLRELRLLWAEWEGRELNGKVDVDTAVHEVAPKLVELSRKVAMV